jgi:hypothetical protein
VEEKVGVVRELVSVDDVIGKCKTRTLGKVISPDKLMDLHALNLLSDDCSLPWVIHVACLMFPHVDSGWERPSEPISFPSPPEGDAFSRR